MRSDFDMIVRQFDDAEPVLVYPLADVHLGAIEHNEKEWEALVKKIAATPNAYVTLGGDLINNNTRSSVGNPWDDVLRPRDQKRLMVEYLEPIRDRILCCVSGNHERRSMKDADDDPTYDIMSKLDIEDVYRPNAAFVKLQLNKERTRPNRWHNCYTIAVTHGAGGGIYTGATVNRNERWGNVIENLDCVIVGHTHKGTITRPSKIVLDPVANKALMKSYLVVSCVSWQTYGSYALQKMLLPAETARPMVLRFQATPNKKDIETVW